MTRNIWFKQLKAWILKRLNREERFGLSLTAGVLIAVAAGLVFGELADEVFEDELFTQFDLAFGQFILTSSSVVGVRLFFTITQLGGVYFLTAAMIFMSLWLWTEERRRDILFLLLAVGGGILINLLIKGLFARARPAFDQIFYQEIGYSFPSGHAMLSLLFFGMAAFLIAENRDNSRYRRGLLLAGLFISLLVGFSRIYLGVHFFSDVIAGWAAGVVWLSTIITARQTLGG